MPESESKSVKLNNELKKMNAEELNNKLNEFRKEYMNLRVEKVVAGRVGQQYNRLSDVQKDIARVLTQIRTLEIDDLKKKYETATLKPKCLLKTTTKAERLMLSAKQMNLRPNKVHKRQRAAPRITFALKN